MKLIIEWNKYFVGDDMDTMAKACKWYTLPKYFIVDMDDVEMAYKCLSNPSKREEYDEYLTSHTKMAGYQRRFYQDFEKDEDQDSDEEKYAKKRSEDRGKRRFEEKDEFFNEDFMHNFYSRSRSGKADEENSENKTQSFSKKGKELKIEVGVSFLESIKGVTKGILIERMIKCPSWKGTRAANENELLNWYSCHGDGIK